MTMRRCEKESRKENDSRFVSILLVNLDRLFPKMVQFDYSILSPCEKDIRNFPRARQDCAKNAFDRAPNGEAVLIGSLKLSSIWRASTQTANLSGTRSAHFLPIHSGDSTIFSATHNTNYDSLSEWHVFYSRKACNLQITIHSSSQFNVVAPTRD